MIASGGHAVAYTIGPIFNIIDCVQDYDYARITT